MTAERDKASRNKGFRFFQDDEDEYSLEDILQAVSFLEVCFHLSVLLSTLLAQRQALQQ